MGPKCWRFSISPSNEYSGLIFFRIDWFPCCPKDSQESSPRPVQKHQSFRAQASLWSKSHIHTWLLEKPHGGIAQSCLTLCDCMDCSPPGSSVHGVFQARVLEWAAISFSRGSSPPRDWTLVSHIVDRHFTVWATREILKNHSFDYMDLCWQSNVSAF